MAKHAWPEALRLLREADQTTPLDAEGLALLGDAAWWTCDIDGCIEARERAYAAYLALGDDSKAATSCLHPYAGLGHYEVGEIRLRMGDLSEAERAFQRAHECGKSPLPGLAILNLVRGDAARARQLLDRALEDTKLPLERAPLLSAHVAVALAQKDVAAAEEAASELRSIADDFSSDAISGAADYAKGRVALGQEWG